MLRGQGAAVVKTQLTEWKTWTTAYALKTKNCSFSKESATKSNPVREMEAWRNGNLGVLVMQTAAKAIKLVKGSAWIQRRPLAAKIVAETWSAGESVIQESLAQVRYPFYLFCITLSSIEELKGEVIYFSVITKRFYVISIFIVSYVILIFLGFWVILENVHRNFAKNSLIQ